MKRASKAARWFSLVVATSVSLIAITAAEASTTVLKGATAIDVVNGRTVRNSVIVIDGDMITAFGGRTTPYSPEAHVIDLTGKYVIPGLIDGHSHYLPYTGEMYLNYGVTGVLAMGPVRSQVGDAYWAGSQNADVRAPRLFGTGSVGLPRRNDLTREEVRAAVKAFVAGNPDFANTPDYTRANKQVWQWMVEDLHASGIAVFGHTMNAAGSIPLGHDVIEHIWGIGQSLMTPAEYENYRQGKYLHWAGFLRDKAGADRMIRDAVRNNDYLNPTLVYNFSSLSAHADEYTRLMRGLYDDPSLKSYFPATMAESYQRRMQSVWLASTKYTTYVRLAQLSQADLAELKADKVLIDQFVGRWVAAGGRIVGGTDDPYVGSPGLSVHLELAMLVEAGLTPMQALKSMTIWSADVTTKRRLVPTKAKVGYIGPGTYADLVVLSADPLVNIDNSRSIERVMKGGKFIRLGYTPSYPAKPAVAIRVVPTVAHPQLSAIAPYAVPEDSPEFELTIDGNGFNMDSVVRIDDAVVPTTFVSSRRLTARVPASNVARGQYNQFRTFGLDQYPGVYGDHAAKVSVFNKGLDGGISNEVFLEVKEKWLQPQGR